MDMQEKLPQVPLENSTWINVVSGHRREGLLDWASSFPSSVEPEYLVYCKCQGVPISLYFREYCGQQLSRALNYLYDPAGLGDLNKQLLTQMFPELEASISSCRNLIEDRTPIDIQIMSIIAGIEIEDFTSRVPNPRGHIS